MVRVKAPIDGGLAERTIGFQAVIKPPRELSVGTVMKSLRGEERKVLFSVGVSASSFVSCRQTTWGCEIKISSRTTSHFSDCRGHERSRRAGSKRSAIDFDSF